MKNRTEKIVFIQEGHSKQLQLEGWHTHPDGYIYAENSFILQTDKIICGEEISVSIRLGIGTGEGNFVIRVGDNDLVINNFPANSPEKDLYLQGVSIGKKIKIGILTDFIVYDSPFEISIIYNQGLLTYQIENKIIYTAKTTIPPWGMIRVNGYTSMIKLYNLECRGNFKTIKEFYSIQFLLKRAKTAIMERAKSIKKDHNRPAYHFLPPANWINDPNGAVFYQGTYHIFYQHNPYADYWDWIHWGHACSKDLVHWKNLPVALCPSIDKGEDHCYSGSACLKDDGQPMILYTSVGPERTEQWAATPLDDELIVWQKHAANPLITIDDHHLAIKDWRDPYLFAEGDDVFMVIGGHPDGGHGSIMLYKAKNKELSAWKFMGIPFSGEENNWECPNVVKINDHHILIYSPHGRVKYYCGQLDTKNVTFTPLHHGIVDHGAEENFYAPIVLQKGDERHILFAWIPGFKENQGWQGCISLPRDLSVDKKGRLIQKPVPELAILRDSLFEEKNIPLNNSIHLLPLSSLQFELMVEITGEGANHIGFRLNQESGEPFEITLSPRELIFGDEYIAVMSDINQKIKTIHLFFDQTVMELFINHGNICATKTIYTEKANLDFNLFSREKIILNSVKIWTLKSIW